MKLRDFQERKAVFIHSILKNGVARRLPEDSETFVFDRTDDGSPREVSTPIAVSGNLLFGAKTWLCGSPPDERPAKWMLQELLYSMDEIDGFIVTEEFAANKAGLLAAADQCSSALEQIMKCDMPNEALWMAFLKNFRAVCEYVEQMDPRHPQFSRWLKSTAIVKRF